MRAVIVYGRWRQGDADRMAEAIKAEHPGAVVLTVTGGDVRTIADSCIGASEVRVIGEDYARLADLVPVEVYP